ncbi:MAG: arginase family protein [Bacteroidota bacterium]
MDQKIDMAEDGSSADTHVGKIFKYNPNFLFNYCHLAYQSYLTSQKDVALLEHLSFETVRLGKIKENIKEIEPYVRDADMLSFDMSALQAFYAPGAEGSTVYGLTGEEACQLSWYAGQNEKLSSIGLYNYDTSKDSEDKKNAFVIATMIWYFIEGFYHRKGEKSFNSNDYLLYEVHLGGDPETIRFFKSKKSEKWWMEVPNQEHGGVFNRNRMIACSYNDYERAQKGEVPDRWFSFLMRS